MLQEIQGVKFSEVLKHNTDLCKPSPKGHAFAVAAQRSLNIRDIESMEIIQRFVCQFSIELCEWSPDSELIFCGNTKKNFVQVFYLWDPSWHCRIEESCLGISDVHWAPDSRHLLIISEFHMRMTVWSLVSKSITHIQNLKPLKSAVCFTSTSKYLIVAEKKDFKDNIEVYACDTWELVKKFNVETKNLSDIQISPDDFAISVLENMTEGFKVLFYSIDGRQLGTYAFDDLDFGIKLLAWSPDSCYIALGDYNGKVHLLHKMNFSAMTYYQHPETIESGNVKVYKVNEKLLPCDEASAFFSNFEQYELVKRRPVSVPCILHKSEESKIKHPVKHGIQTLNFSKNGRYLASINGSMPKVIWIFDMEKLDLSDVIIQSHTIKNISWHTTKPILAISTGTSTVYIWTQHGCLLMKSPFEDPFSLNNVTWCGEKEVAVLNGKGNSSILCMS